MIFLFDIDSPASSANAIHVLVKAKERVPAALLEAELDDRCLTEGTALLHFDESRYPAAQTALLHCCQPDVDLTVQNALTCSISSQL